MDFCKLLHTAQRNDQSSSNGVRYYSTKFEPPKKLQKNTKEVSVNVKKFLERKEAEERKKAEEAQRKKEELLALRSQDKKATRRVNVMLKRTKSANQSVIEDAVDRQHTAVTRAGTEQPDEDDYGYVSQEASAFYEKMIEKYKDMPEEPKFNLFKKKVSTNLSSTKDRVKAALDKEREDALHPHRRKRKRRENEEQDEDVKDDEHGRDVESQHQTVLKPKPKPKPAPPPMSFNDLLKIAEKKQFEPIVIEQKPKEEEKLLTKKQKKEAEREREWRERREGKLPPVTEKQPTSKMPVTDKPRSDKPVTKSISDADKVPKSQNLENRSLAKTNNGFKKPQIDVRTIKSQSVSHPKSEVGGKSTALSSAVNKSVSLKTPSTKEFSAKKPAHLISDRQRVESKQVPHKAQTTNAKPILNGNLKPKEFPPRDLISKKLKAVENNSRQPNPKDVKPRQFPPSDVRQRDFSKKRSLPPPSKRRIIDDDEDEYDSELDDFIDDGPEEEQNYSSYIKEIFGYDKSKYRGLDDDVDDMESSFAQQMREEIKSTKIAISEDLEEMKKEQEEKRRKALMKKKLKQR